MNTLLSTSSLRNTTVVNRQGEDLGSITVEALSGLVKEEINSTLKSF